nr:zf-HC2 domain-containing protein [Actinoplanes sp. ATCC 53533]
MADMGGDEPHVTELLGLYYLDTLGSAEGALIEEHLPACASCRDEAQQVIDTVAALALLSERDRDEVLDSFGALNRSGPPSERFVRFFAPEPEADPPLDDAQPVAARQPRRLPFRKRRAAVPSPEPVDPPVAPPPITPPPVLAPPPVAAPLVAPPAIASRPVAPPPVAPRPVAPPPVSVPSAVPDPEPVKPSKGKLAKAEPTPIAAAKQPVPIDQKPVVKPPAPVEQKPEVKPPEQKPAVKPPAPVVQKPVEQSSVVKPAVQKPVEQPSVVKPAVQKPVEQPSVVKPVEQKPVVKLEPPAFVLPQSPAPRRAELVRREVSEARPPLALELELVRPRGRNPRRTALIRMSMLLTLVLVIGGLALGALLRGEREARTAAVPVVTAAATAADRTTGASLSVFVTQQEAGVNVRATVDGLRPGVGYRLQAVTSDGHAWPVVNWTSDGKLQEITADVGVPLSTLVFFTVSRAGSGPVVSAYLGPGGARR